MEDLSPETRVDNVELIKKDYTLVRSKVRPFLNGLGVSISFDLSLSDSILKKNIELIDLQYLLNDVFSNILNLLRQNAQANSLIKIVVFQDELDSPLVVPLMSLSRLRPSLILEKIEHLSQSKKGIKADKSFVCLFQQYLFSMQSYKKYLFRRMENVQHSIKIECIV